jgi:hypothetical protein
MQNAIFAKTANATSAVGGVSRKSESGKSESESESVWV